MTVPANPADKTAATKAWEAAERNSLEHACETLLIQHGFPPFVREHQPTPGRQFRADFAWLPQRAILEVEGLVYDGKGRHQMLAGYTTDCEKYNLAQAAGWRVFRCTQLHIKKRAGVFFPWLLSVL